MIAFMKKRVTGLLFWSRGYCVSTVGGLFVLPGFPKIHFHDLRHTFCSNLILAGADLKDVKEMIGHRDLSMTDRYSHLTNARKLSKQDDLARFYAGHGSGSRDE